MNPQHYFNGLWPYNCLDCKVHISLKLNVLVQLFENKKYKFFHLFESILLKFQTCRWVLYDSMYPTQKIMPCDI
jgi:hypothetical protein